MSAILLVARREILEQRRQPAMLAVIGALYAIVAGFGLVGVAALDQVARHPEGLELVRELLPGSTVDGLVEATLSFQTFLGFTQYLGICAVSCGHAVLHDRQCGTFTFLLMAPVRRAELLVGKVAGAVAWPTLGYVVVNVIVAGAELLFPLATARGGAWLPSSERWWIALLLCGPALALAVGTVCAALSSVARDVRTAQQGTWFVVFFASLAAGGLLTWSLGAGLVEQVAVVGLALTGALAALSAGTALLARDLGR